MLILMSYFLKGVLDKITEPSKNIFGKKKKKNFVS
jgi:hypothetical protein